MFYKFKGLLDNIITQIPKKVLRGQSPFCNPPFQYCHDDLPPSLLSICSKSLQLLSSLPFILKYKKQESKQSGKELLQK